MDLTEIYHFLFETYTGIGILMGAGIVLSIIACVIFEFRTRKLYHDHEPAADEWSLFYDEIEEGEDQEEEESAKKIAQTAKKSAKNR